MGNERFSLMTFNIAKDFPKKTMTVRDSLELAADAGIPYVDIIRVDPADIPEYQEAMAATKVQVRCYITCISFFEEEQAIRDALDGDMAAARALNAALFMIIPFCRGIDNQRAREFGRERVLELMVRGFRLAVEKGRKYGLGVCFETTPAEEIRLSGTEDCKYVLDRVPGLGLVFDTANMLPHGDETLASYESLKEYIVHVHLKDVVLMDAEPSQIPDERAADGRLIKGTVFGQGVIPVREVYERMKKDGYGGVFAIEYMRPGRQPCTFAEHKRELERYLAYMG